MNHRLLSDALIDGDDYGLNIESGTFAKSIIKKEIIKVIDFFLSFLTRYNEKKTHNMLALMLDPRFKNLRLIFSFIGHEHGVAIVKNIIVLKSYIIV
jgi:hypothetical protein